MNINHTAGLAFNLASPDTLTERIWDIHLARQKRAMDRLGIPASIAIVHPLQDGDELEQLSKEMIICRDADLPVFIVLYTIPELVKSRESYLEYFSRRIIQDEN